MMIRKPNFGTVIFLAVAIGLVVSSYTPAHSAQTGTTSTKPKEFKLSSFGARTSVMMPPVMEFCETIGKYTNNTVKVKFYAVDEIAGTKDLPALLKKGSIDFIAVAPSYFPALFPLANSLQQLTLLNKTPEQAQYAWRALFKEFPEELQKEFTAQNAYLINRSSLGRYDTLSKTPINGVADLKGLKIRTWGGKLSGEFLQAMGATPVFVAPADYYEGLMRGVYDAFIGDMQQMLGYKLYENAKYLGMPTGAIVGWFISMNLDRWNELTPSQQQAITRAGTEWGAKDLALCMEYGRNGRSLLEAKGVKYIEFPEKEHAIMLAKFGDPWERIQQVMKQDLKIDPAFTEKFVTRYHQLVTEFDAKYLKTGKHWIYE